MLALLPKDFDEKIEAKKWSERKEAMDALVDLIDAHPRLDTKAQYGEVVAIIRKVGTFNQTRRVKMNVIISNYK